MSDGRQRVELVGGTYMLCGWLFAVWIALVLGFHRLVDVLTEILEKMP